MPYFRFPAALMAWLIVASVASAHVHLVAPNGGEAFRGGSPITIQWQVVISHGTQGWDLEYSLQGASGPWAPLALGLAPGDIQAGAVHSFVWTPGSLDTTTARIRVRQVNTGMNYEDISDQDFSIRSELTANLSGISVANGGVQVLTFDAGIAHAGETFAVIGSVSGTNPGVSFGGLTIPLNPDFYFDQTVQFPNAPPLMHSFGGLDAFGLAVTTVTINAGELPPQAAGVVVHHAALTLDPTFQPTLISNPTKLDLLP
ncbi:MAG: hypothetical protein KDB53_16560 [Planctomycetes bacterium]|nr:hypothetical protein [Planctomycetota bacterium]